MADNSVAKFLVKLELGKVEKRERITFTNIKSQRKRGNVVVGAVKPLKIEPPQVHLGVGRAFYADRRLQDTSSG